MNEFSTTPNKEQERDFFTDPTILVNSILSKDYTACISRIHSHPEEVSTWMVISGPSQTAKQTANGNSRDKLRRQYNKEKRVSLRNLYADDDDADEYEGEDQCVAQNYLLRRLPLHFACSMIPDTDFGSNPDDKILEELILSMIEINPLLCKRGDKDGRLALHEAVQYDVSAAITECLLRTFPQATRLSDSYGRTPISVRTIRCNSKSIRVEEDPIYALLMKGVKYWSDEVNKVSVIDDASDWDEEEDGNEDDDNISKSGSDPDEQAAASLGLVKTFGSRHEQMILRKSLEQKEDAVVSPGENTTPEHKLAGDDAGNKSIAPQFDLRCVFAESKGVPNSQNASEMAIISEQDTKELEAPHSPGRRPRRGVNVLSRSTPPFPTHTGMQTPSSQRSDDTVVPSQSSRDSAILSKTATAAMGKRPAKEARHNTRSQQRHKAQKKPDATKRAADEAVKKTATLSESEEKLYKKYKHLKQDFKQCQSTNHQLAKQMRKMQVEKEEQIHRLKSRTKTTISNLRSDLAKLNDEKFVLMAAMEELKNKCDHFEIENDLLRNMYESSKQSAKLSNDIHEMASSKIDEGVSESFDDDHMEHDNQDEVTVTVSEERSVSVSAQLGKAAIRKVQAATMKISEIQASARSTIDTAATDYTPTSTGTLALTAAMKMIALAKQENDDDLQTIASEALAVNAETATEINPRIYQFLQDENKKLKEELEAKEYEKGDLEDSIYRLRLAVTELSSRKSKRHSRFSDTSQSVHTKYPVLESPHNLQSLPETRAVTMSDNAMAGLNYSLDYASAPPRIETVESSNDSVNRDNASAPASLGVSGFDKNLGQTSAFVYEVDSESDEEDADYKEEYLALLEALKSSDRYATESFLTTRIRDLEFQLEDTIVERGLGEDRNARLSGSSAEQDNSGAAVFSRLVLPELKKESKFLYVEGK